MTVPDATTDDVTAREFTPSMQHLRAEYVQMRAEHYGFSDLYAAEFDRALAQRDARVRAEALREAARDLEPGPDNPRQSPPGRLVRRTRVDAARRLRLRADRVERGESR